MLRAQIASLLTQLGQTLSQFRLEPAIGGLVVLAVSERLGKERLFGDCFRQIVWGLVAGAATELARAGVVGVLEIGGRQLCTLLSNVLPGAGDRPVAGVRLRRERQIG